MPICQLIESENALIQDPKQLLCMTHGCQPVFCSLSTECLMTQPFNSTGPDNNLDVVISLLAFGSTPMSAATRRREKFLTLRGTMPSTSHLSAALSAPRTSSIYHLFCVCVWRKSSLQAWLRCLCSYSRCHDGNTLMCAASS